VELREEKAPGDDYPYLSTGDVFCWLADTGLSLRQAVPQSAPINAPPGKRTAERIPSSAVNTYCTTCGLESAWHPSASSSWEGETSGGFCCHGFSMSRLPLLDVGPIACPQSQNRSNGPVVSNPDEKDSFPWSNREILAATDPTLTIAVRCIVASMELSCFPELDNASICGAGVLRPNSTATPAPMADRTDISTIRSDVKPVPEVLSGSLASSAVLGLAVREFARRLLSSAVTAFANDHGRAKGGPRAVLTPAHVSVDVAGSFLTRDGVLRDDVPPSPVALVLATLVRCLPRELSPPSAITDILRRDSVSSVRSSSHHAFEG
jgi:hypothetical protein